MDILDDEILFDEKNLLMTIWTKPTLTLTYILKHCPKKYVTSLLILGGMVNALNQNFQHLLLHKWFYSILLLTIVMILGGLFGWIFSYLYAALLSWTGGWIKGKANTDQFMTVLSWAMVPSICTIILLLPELLFFENGIVDIDIHEQSILKIVAYVLIIGSDFVLAIWTLVIMIKGIALVQKFSIKKAIWNAILPLLVIVIPVFIILGVIYIFQ
jgi:hypothetical protein